jgi:hypothetical protein
MTNPPCGLGAKNPQLLVYIANRPPLDEYQTLCHVKALQFGDIAGIAQQTGNHWRKIFNVYAKLVFALNPVGHSSWQNYRDNLLLTKDSQQALLFSRPDLQQPGVHIITGRTYAKSLQLDACLVPIDADFQIDSAQRLIIAPYFDYRQLNNEKMARLSKLIQQLNQG